MTDTGLTAADIARLHDIHAKNARLGNGPTRTDRIPQADCRAWRERRAAGERPVDIAIDTEWSSHTVKRHANGRCSHD